MHYAHSLPRHLPFDITENATAAFSYTGRSIPSSGLTLEQMILALNNMGYFPIYYKKPHRGDYEKDKEYELDRLLWQPLDTIYPYIESQIPVIIGLRNHARTVVGYKMYDNLSDITSENILNEVNRQKRRLTGLFPKNLSPAIIPSSIFSDGLIIHDDQEGIYRLMPYDKKVRDILKRNYSELFPKNNIEVDSSIFSIIIPLPDKIYLSADDVFYTAVALYIDSLLLFLIKQADKGNENAKALVKSSFNDNDPLVFRIYFIKGVDFKSRVKSNLNINDKVRDYYISMDMSRFIWVVEISNYSVYGKTRNIFGEIIFDSTANKYDFKGSFLSIHLPGFFYQNERVSGSRVIDEDIPMEQPYKILNHNVIHICTII